MLPRFTLDGSRDSVPCTVHRHRLDCRAIAPHTHDHTEVVLVLSGKGVHSQMGRNHPVGRRDILIVNEGCSHAIPEAEGLALSNVKFNANAFLAQAQELTTTEGYQALFCLRHDPPPDAIPPWSIEGTAPPVFCHLRPGEEAFARLEQIAATIEEEAFHDHLGREPLLRALIIQFVTGLCRLAPVKQNQTSVRRPFGHVIGYLESSFYHQITLPNLARMAGLSVNQFLRVFGRFYHCTPMQYLMRRRLAHACELLGHSRMQITRVAQESGFEDSNYFSRQFIRHYGMNPRDYRKQLQSCEGVSRAGH